MSGVPGFARIIDGYKYGLEAGNHMSIASLAVKAISGSNGDSNRRNKRRDTGEVKTGDGVQRAEQQREKEEKEILQLADQARAEMRKAKQKSGSSKFGELEDEVRQNMGQIEKIVKENEEEFENVHSNVINAEVSGENLSEVDNEIQQMVSNTQNEFGKVERLASQSLEELEEVRNATGTNNLLGDAEQRIQKIEELAQEVTKLEVAELEEEQETAEEEADFEQRYKRNSEAIQKIITLVEDRGQNPQTVEEEVFSNVSPQQLEQLKGDLEYMIQEGRDIEEKAEREPEEVEMLFSRDEEVLELLQDYIDRHSN
jgi:chromosome segregation ATPase